MFRGEYGLTMDTKGRLAVPSRYRDRVSEACGGKLIVTISMLERCLAVYPFSYWQHIEEELENLPAFDTQAQAINHLLIGHANECDMDSHGRLLIPQSLREFAGLEKHIKMVGQVKRFELWDEAVWAARREELMGQVEQFKREPTEALRGLVL